MIFFKTYLRQSHGFHQCLTASPTAQLLVCWSCPYPNINDFIFAWPIWRGETVLVQIETLGTKIPFKAFSIHSASWSLWELWKLNSSEIQWWAVAEPCIQLVCLMLAQWKCQEEVRNNRSVELLLSSAAKSDAGFKCHNFGLKGWR